MWSSVILIVTHFMYTEAALYWMASYQAMPIRHTINLCHVIRPHSNRNQPVHLYHWHMQYTHASISMVLGQQQSW